MTLPDQIPVRHNSASNRFEIEKDGALAVLDYLLRKNEIVFIHTGVPPEWEGRGIGSRLARAGLEYARAQKKKVVPLCWFVRGFIERHPEYQDLLEKEGG